MLPLMGLTPSSLPDTLGTLRRVDHCLETTQATRSWCTVGTACDAGADAKATAHRRPVGTCSPNPASQCLPGQNTSLMHGFQQDPKPHDHTLFRRSVMQSTVTQHIQIRANPPHERRRAEAEGLPVNFVAGRARTTFH